MCNFYSLCFRLSPNGEFALPTSSRFCAKNSSTTMVRIRSELVAVRSTLALKKRKLQSATDAHIGLEILHLIVLDLLGRDSPAARIFEMKSDEE